MSEHVDHNCFVIPEETAKFLELEGLLSPAQNNKRKLSVSVFSSSSGSSPNEVADQIMIPDALKSKETCEFIGFTKDVAVDIWRRFITKPADMDDDFIDFAVAHVELHPFPDATSSTDDWHECLRVLGINHELSHAIMMPEFEDIRYTASCKHWVLESIESNYNALASLDEDLRAAQTRIQGFRKIGRHQETPFTPRLESFPGHHMIWHVCDKAKAARFYDPITHAVSLSAVRVCPGDFSGTVVVGYFTPQKETADRYACWRKHKQHISDIRIIQIAVPDLFIKSISVHYLWYGDQSRPTDEWKFLIWHSRRGEYLPIEMEWLENQDLLIGNIASGKNCKYENIREPAAIKDSDVLTIERDGVQIKAI
ncbi:hypothetical protein SLS56_002089 [Neofusicoccum ribis]|uniref:Uncharacterized protein n=1 Tax=Neofusicoccum ribis TaxID=45134 RepID=A0ABR3T5R3_9PEZI